MNKIFSIIKLRLINNVLITSWPGKHFESNSECCCQYSTCMPNFS